MYRKLNSTVVQGMACRQVSANPFSEPIVTVWTHLLYLHVDGTVHICPSVYFRLKTQQCSALNQLVLPKTYQENVDHLQKQLLFQNAVKTNSSVPGVTNSPFITLSVSLFAIHSIPYYRVYITFVSDRSRCGCSAEVPVKYEYDSNYLRFRFAQWNICGNSLTRGNLQ